MLSKKLWKSNANIHCQKYAFNNIVPVSCTAITRDDSRRTQKKPADIPDIFQSRCFMITNLPRFDEIDSEFSCCVSMEASLRSFHITQDKQITISPWGHELRYRYCALPSVNYNPGRIAFFCLALSSRAVL